MNAIKHAMNAYSSGSWLINPLAYGTHSEVKQNLPPTTELAMHHT